MPMTLIVRTLTIVGVVSVALLAGVTRWAARQLELADLGV